MRNKCCVKNLLQIDGSSVVVEPVGKWETIFFEISPDWERRFSTFPSGCLDFPECLLFVFFEVFHVQVADRLNPVLMHLDG